jgi:catechol 2,3-dioxygenase-like lactoylglutathione lyase family enzyme
MKLAEVAYFTKNLQGMIDFYRKLLSAEPVAQSEGMAIFLVEGTKIFIHLTYEMQPGGLPPENHKAFQVEDVDRACAILASQGVIVEVEPADYYWGRSAYLRDPDGHLIELAQADNI